MSEKAVIERCMDCHGTAANACVMWRALPVPYFGPLDGNTLKVATVGLNPSATEFVNERLDWREAIYRLPVVMDWDLETRSALTETSARKATMLRANYFAQRKERMHPWFLQVEGVMRAVRRGWSFKIGTAVHLDLVACPTWQDWGDLRAEAQSVLLEKCFPNFCATLQRLHEGVWLLLDGRTVSETIMKRCEALELKRAVLNGRPELEVWSGRLSDRFGRHRFLGWSNPINRQKNQQALVTWLRHAVR